MRKLSELTIVTGLILVSILPTIPGPKDSDDPPTGRTAIISQSDDDFATYAEDDIPDEDDTDDEDAQPTRVAE